MLRLLVLLVVACAIAYPVFARARRQAQASARARRRLIVRAGLGLVAAGVIGVWLPRHVPETQGSPATIVALLVLWVVGGVLAFMSIAALLGATIARPPLDGAS